MAAALSRYTTKNNSDFVRVFLWNKSSFFTQNICIGEEAMQIKQELSKIDEFDIKQKTKGHWFELVLANMLAIAFTALGFFIPVLSIALAFIIMAYMQIGLYKFVLKSYRGESVDYDALFLPFSQLIKILCIKIIAMSGMLLWGLLLIVPGVIYGLNCSFCGLVYLENPELSIKEIFSKSKQLVQGHRTMILLVALVGLVMLCAAASIGVGLHFLFSLAFKVPPALTAFLILVPIFVTFVVAAAPLFQVYLAGAYDKALSLAQKKPKNVSKSKKNVV